MPAVAACPTDEQLLTPGVAAEAVSSHLAGCAHCRNRLAAMSGRDSTARPSLAEIGTLLPAKAPPNVPRSAVPPKIPTADLPPELLNHPDYTEIRELGRGGMGVVYLAKHKLLKRWEVLKVMGKQQMAQAGAADRFLQEVQSAARLQHPNVVKAYTATRLGDSIAFAMEYVPGDDLDQVVKMRGPLSIQAATFYTAQVALGLQHAHEKGMVHRDIKPANLILLKEGTKHIVKILDFGLAKVTSERAADTGLTGDGQMMGTPDYMSPEQSLDAAKADIRADIYSLGVTLYFLLTATSPFRRTSLLATLQAHQTDTARLVNEVRPEVPAELAAVVAKMLAKNPAERYQTPGEVVAMLKPFAVAKSAVPAATPVAPAGQEVPMAGVAAVPAKAKAIPATPLSLPGVSESIWDAMAQGKSRSHAKLELGNDEDNPKKKRGLVLVLGGLVLFGFVLLGLGALWAGGAFQSKTTQESAGLGTAKTRETEPQGSPSPVAPKFGLENSDWAGHGLIENKRMLGAAWTFTERNGDSFKALWRGGSGNSIVLEGRIDDTGRMVIESREYLKPSAKPREAFSGGGEVSENRMLVHFTDPNTQEVFRGEFKRLPDAGKNFRFLGRWKCTHRPNNWVGFRTVTPTKQTTDRPQQEGDWERDGGLIIAHFPGGGREWLIVDPDKPSELHGSNGVQSVTWVRQ